MTTKNADLRSDTVTLPTSGMRAAMQAAPLGDDVFAADPSVNALQDKIADMLGFEATPPVHKATCVHCSATPSEVTNTSLDKWHIATAGRAAVRRCLAACSRSRYLAHHPIQATGLYRLRFVTHLVVDVAGVDRAAAVICDFFKTWCRA